MTPRGSDADDDEGAAAQQVVDELSRTTSNGDKRTQGKRE